MALWTDEEVEFLKENYPSKGKRFCAETLARTDGAIRSKACELKLKSDFKFNDEVNHRRGSGFRGKKRPAHSRWLKDNFDTSCMRTKEARRKNSEAQKALIKNGKPTDNFKGKKHTPEAKAKISKASKETWRNPNHFLNSEEHRQAVSDRSSRFQQENPTLNRHSRGKGSHIVLGGKKYWFRSSWEVFYAQYLQFLLEAKAIKKWEYETDTFWFDKIKRGVRSYKPDFKVIENNGNFSYHEVKGYMDDKSKTKLKRMKKYYPDVNIRIVDKTVIKNLKRYNGMWSMIGVTK